MGPAIASPSPPADPELSFDELLHLLWRRRWWLAGALLTGLWVALALLLMLPPIYQAEALLLVEPRGSPVAAELGASSFMDRLVDRDGITIDSQVEVLSSRNLLQAALNKLHADNPQQREDGAETVETLLARLEVKRQGKTRVIAVRVRDRDPHYAARLVNAIVEAYLVDQLAGKFATANRTAEWFEDKLRSLEQQVAKAEAQAVAFREHNAHLFDVALARVEERLADLEREYLLAQAERRALEARVAKLKRRAQDSAIDTATLGSMTPLLSALEASEAELVRRDAQLRGLYGEKHPLLADLARQKEQLSQRIAAERQAILARFEADVAQAAAREASLAEELARIRRLAGEARRAELQKRQLEREVELARQLYEAFAKRFATASNSEAMEQADARVIAEATPPKEPIFPKAQVVLPVSLITGLGLGLVGLFLREKLDRRLVTTRDIARELGLTTLALVPELHRRRGAPPPHEHVLERPHSHLAEALRELLMRILASRQEGTGQILLVVSALPGEGKSTLVLALGRVARHEGLRVLVIDGDLRKPTLASMAGVGAQAGLVEVLEGGLAFADAVRRDRTGLELVPGSRRPSHLISPPAGERLQALFAELRSRYDLILLDSSPLAAVADAQLFAQAVDGILYLIRWRHVPSPIARHAVDSLAAARARLLGAVLCRVKAPVFARYGDAAGEGLARRLAAYYTE